MISRHRLLPHLNKFAALISVGLYICLALSAMAADAAGFDFASTPGQLPKIAYPRHYVINLKPDIDTRKIDGSETIDVDVLKPTKSLYLNVRNMEVGKAELIAGSVSTPLEATVDTSTEILTLTSPTLLNPGPVTIGISYTGHIIDAPQGLYKVTYFEKGKTNYMLASQLESTDARRVFPSWDEPAYRATYQINATFPKGIAAYSNMPPTSVTTLGKLTTYHFAATPPMASYLNALCAGDLQSTSKNVDGTKVEVVCTRGKLATAKYALDIESQILPYYNSYFGQKFPLPKLDLVGVPGGFPGAMENWGCIVFDEDYLLYDPGKVGLAQKEEIYSFIAHETAHQWFGDLVTMAWWNDIWLNEGFASWMEDKAPAKFNPDWNVWRYARYDEYGVMDQDSQPSTHSVVQPLKDPNQIEDAFDDITYVKGESVIRMLEQYLGEDTFRAGIRIYMDKHKYSNATSADLWDALSEASGKPVAEIASSWINQPGMPLVHASFACDGATQTVTLTQSRFTFQPTESTGQLWEIPVTLYDKTNPATQTVLMTGATMTLPMGACGDTIIVGSGATGYYRVEYDDPMLAQIESGASSLSAIDRLDLLSDQWALVSANKSKASSFLALVQSLPANKSYEEWRAIGSAFSSILTEERGDPDKPAFEEYVRSQFGPVHQQLGWNELPDDSADDQKLRNLAIEQLASADDADVIAESKSRFADYVEDPKTLSLQGLPQVLNIVGRNADQKTYDELHNLAKAAQDRSLKDTFYRAMFHAHDPKLAQENLELTESGEIKGWLAREDTSMVAKTGQQFDLAWAFVKTHYASLTSTSDTFAKNGFVPRFFQSFDDMKYADELQTFAKANLSSDAEPLVAAAVDSIKSNAQFRSDQIPSVDSWLASPKQNNHA